MIEIRDRIAEPFSALNGIPATIAGPELGARPGARWDIVASPPGGLRLSSRPYDAISAAHIARR